MPSPNNKFSEELERVVKPIYESYVHYSQKQGYLCWASFGEILAFYSILLKWNEAIKKLEKKK